MTPPRPSPPRVLFHVQHLLGIGHLRRAAAIARGLTEAGLAVTVAAGGEPVPGIDFGSAELVQLPAARAAAADFATILDEAGRPLDGPWWGRRRSALLELFRTTAPAALLIELYPFGRRPFRHELLPLLELAAAQQNRPAILCSLRDILVDKGKPGRAAETVGIVRHHFDRVLVHGDPRVARLEASFPAAAEIADRLAYTGYVVERPVAATEADTAPGEEVLVSVGGGAVGGALLRSSLAARPLTRLADRPWRLVAGRNLPEAELSAIRAAAGLGVAVERFRPDLASLFGRCAVSVSQGGYNTVMELIAARARAVVVPFAAPGETEQLQRARLLATRGLITLAEDGADKPARLAAAIDEAVAAGRPPAAALDLDGATATARLIRELVAG
jgi:predicted glycosyltransferase